MLRVAYGQKGAKWKELTDTVTYFIAKDYLPIYIYVQLGKMILLSLEAIPPTPSYTREHLPTLGHTLLDLGTPSHTGNTLPPRGTHSHTREHSPALGHTQAWAHPPTLGTPHHTGAHTPTLGNTLLHWATPSHTGPHLPTLGHTAIS